MIGETVIVKYRESGGVDELNNPVWTYEEIEVTNVLVAPGASTDMPESTRPDGVTIEYTLYFPKDFTGNLEHSQVSIRGEWLYVVGSPRPFDLVNCPTEWNMVAEVTRENG